MIKNIIFDYGGVLLDWNPHYLYDGVFGSAEKADWFLKNICTYEWNQQHDKGKPVAEGTQELVDIHPEWEREIRMYYDGFKQMMGGQIPGMEELIRELKREGLRIFGLTNWSDETFSRVRNDYPIISLIEDMVVSGQEKLMKPDPKIFEIAVNRFCVKLDETLFVDDNQANVDAARAFGLNAVQFTGASELRNYFLTESVLTGKVK